MSGTPPEHKRTDFMDMAELEAALASLNADFATTAVDGDHDDTESLASTVSGEVAIPAQQARNRLNDRLRTLAETTHDSDTSTSLTAFAGDETSSDSDSEPDTIPLTPETMRFFDSRFTAFTRTAHSNDGCRPATPSTINGDVEHPISPNTPSPGST